MNFILRIWKKYSFIIFLSFIVLGMLDVRFAIVAIVCMIAPIGIALVGKGRFWCGNLCPRGNFYDRVLSKVSSKKKVAKFLKSLYFRIGIIIFMFYMFGSGVSKNWGNLYGIGMVFYRMIVMTTVVGITLSYFYNHRTWCNFCPMGSIAGFISKVVKPKTALKVSNTCVSCKICDKKCPMGISPYDYKNGQITHSDCIQCGECALSCGKKSIGY